MSFEGYDRFLCKNGHLWELDIYKTMYDDEKQKCPICKEKEIWNEMIDETNGDGSPTKLKINKKKSKICEHCNTVLEAVYMMPKKNGKIKRKKINN